MAAVSALARASWLLGLALGALLAGMAAVGQAEHTWATYMQLAALLLVLMTVRPVTRRAAREEQAGAWVAAALLAAAVLLSTPGAAVRTLGFAAGGPAMEMATAWLPAAAPIHGITRALLWCALMVLAGVGAAVHGGWRAVQTPGLSLRLQGTVLFVAAGVLAVSLAVVALPGMRSLWPGSLQWLLYPVVWLGLARWWVSCGPGDRKWLLRPATVVVAAVCLVGAGRVAAAAYQLWAGDRAVAAGKPAQAAQAYGAAQSAFAGLGLSGVEEQARLGLAQALAAQGSQEQAYGLLGIDPSEGVVIAPDQWQGQAGGHLFRNTSCWHDLWLWEGEVEVEINAGGRQAGGVWPELRVQLNGQELGRMIVDAPQGSTQTFRAQVATGRHRLRVSLVQGLWSSRGEHRTARLDTVRVRYPVMAPW